MKSKSNANESARTMRANIVGATNCTLNGINYQIVVIYRWVLEHTVDGFLLAVFFRVFFFLGWMTMNEPSVVSVVYLQQFDLSSFSSAFRIFDLIIMVTRRFKNNIVVVSSSTSSCCTLKCQPFLIWMLNSWFHAWWKKEQK